MVHAVLDGVLRFAGGSSASCCGSAGGKPLAQPHARNAALRYHGAVRFIAVWRIRDFVAIGGWIFYNTKVLNTVRSENDNDTPAGRLRKDLQEVRESSPSRGSRTSSTRSTCIRRSRNMTMRGQQTIVNQTSKPLTEIHFTLSNDYQTTIEIRGREAVPGRPAPALSDLRSGHADAARRVARPAISPWQTKLRGFENTVTNRASCRTEHSFNSHDRAPDRLSARQRNCPTRTNASATD